MAHIYKQEKAIEVYNDIINFYSKNIREIISLFDNKTTNKKLFIKNFNSALLPILTLAIRKNIINPLFIIANDNEEALYILKDLKFLSQRKYPVFYFPASHKKPTDIDSIENANQVKRTQLINFLSKLEDTRFVVVSYPEAIVEKIIAKKEIKLHSYKLQVGDDINQDFLIELLEEYNFRRVPFVYEPGEFAVRGGILDLFPYSEDAPIRIEFFGDIIESIRYFNPATQLSTKKIEKIEIVPNISKTSLVKSKQNIMEELPNNTIFLLQDEKIIKHKIKSFYERIKNYKSETEEEKEINISYYSTPEEVSKFLSYSNIIVYEGTSSEYPNQIDWNVEPQGNFDKYLQTFSKYLNDLFNQGYSVYIASDYEKQLKRIDQILSNYEVISEPLYLLPTLSKGFVDKKYKIAFFTEHQLFSRYHSYKARKSRKISAKEALVIRDLSSLKPGDYVVHEVHGIGIFAGIRKIKIGNSYQDAVKILYRGDDAVFVPIHSLHKIYKYTADVSKKPKLSKLGSKEWLRKTQRIRKKVKELSFDIVKLYAQRKMSKGFAFPKDDIRMHTLEASFYFDETEDQLKAIEDVKKDMEKPFPMDRLICGDVGFGKTEVAIRAAFKAVLAKKQVAVLVPTTILAMQHYKTFSERLNQFNVKIEYINRLKSRKEQREILKRLKSGEIDIIIGTHRLLSKDVEFYDLGLLIIDEEQRFGVSHKEKIRLLRVNVDTLTLTATPIPRTLQSALTGIRDISIIATPPHNRQPIETNIITFDREIIRDAISRELERRGQVIFVHNNVAELPYYASEIKKLVPDAKIVITHGQMDPKELERKMTDFINEKYNVLVTTTIIESGLDMPNVNTLFVNDAHKRFGLSQLHQIRGRIGRSYKKAYCYFIAPPMELLPKDAQQRLKTLVEFSDLGSGFQIAMKDLELRGGGNIFGAEQSGFIDDVGFEYYNQILQDAIEELKVELLQDSDEIQKPIKDRDIQIETDLPIYIPNTYISDTTERMLIYQRITNAKNENELKEIQKELRDRFGKIPTSVLNLLDTVRIRFLAKELKISRVRIKSKRMELFFSPEFHTNESITKLLEILHLENVKFHIASKGELMIIKMDITLPQEALMLLELIKRKISLEEKLIS